MATVTGAQEFTPSEITLDRVGLTFGDHVVSRDISLTISPGEVLSIVGPSGCGKTTLLRAIAGLVQPAEGSITIDGRVVDETPAGVAMVFQQFGLFPWKTVESNIAYGLRTTGMSKTESIERSRHFLELVGLATFARSYPHQLSGGMQQRAGLARALAVHPQVLLMDEPFGALDAQTREVLQYEMLAIREEVPSTMVFVTHAIEEAVLFGDRVAVLGGRPSSVRELITVDIPEPRDRASARSSRFLDLREHIWSLVMEKE